MKNSEKKFSFSVCKGLYIIDVHSKLFWTYFSLDDEGTISTDGDLLLHHTEVVEPADEESCTVGS